MHRTAQRIAAAALLLLLALPAVPAQAGEVYPPQGVAVDQGVVDRAVVDEGDTVRLRGGGFLPGTLVTVDTAGEPVGQLRADERGQIDARVPVGASGLQLLSATGRGSAGGLQVVSAPVRVLPAGGRSFSDGPSRSSDVLPGLLRGLVLVVLCACLTFLVRLARRPAAPA